MAQTKVTRTRRPAQRFSIRAMLVQMHHLASQRRTLRALEPHQLRDVGLSASQAKKEANRPFWDAPAHWKQR